LFFDCSVYKYDSYGDWWQELGMKLWSAWPLVWWCVVFKTTFVWSLWCCLARGGYSSCLEYVFYFVLSWNLGHTLLSVFYWQVLNPQCIYIDHFYLEYLFMFCSRVLIKKFMCIMLFLNLDSVFWSEETYFIRDIYLCIYIKDIRECIWCCSRDMTRCLYRKSVST
jgi:hypothetical protein